MVEVVTVNNASGNDRVALVNQDYGGEVQVKNPSGQMLARINGAGVIEAEWYRWIVYVH